MNRNSLNYDLVEGRLRTTIECVIPLRGFWRCLGTALGHFQSVAFQPLIVLVMLLVSISNVLIELYYVMTFSITCWDTLTDSYEF